MNGSFLDSNYQPSETSAKLAFGGNQLERLSEYRDDNAITDALANPTARIFGMAKGRVLMAMGESPRGLMTLDELAPFEPKPDQMVLMGHDKGAPRLAVPLGIDPDDDDLQLPAPYQAINFRALAAEGLLSHEELGQMAQGAAYLAWHASARFCGRCGSETQMRHGGVKRHCSSCDRDQFPRTDPVVIMLTVHEDKCLLGRSHHFPPGMYSALAGFVEAGETIEMAVRRETFEESGIRVGDVSYHASQPWPFPHTLMIGCYGKSLGTEIVKDATELDDCRWFTKQEVRVALKGEGPRNEDGTLKFSLPPKLAIANRLVSDWARQD